MGSAAGSEYRAERGVHQGMSGGYVWLTSLAEEKIDSSICLKIRPAADLHSGDFPQAPVTW